MLAYPYVFSPIKIGNVTIKNRIATPPMLSCLASADGMVTREMMDFYGAFARGGAGIVNIGDSAVDNIYAMGHHSQLNLGDDRVIAGLSNFVETLQKTGAKASAELNHPGRMATKDVLNGRHPIAPSDVMTGWQELAFKATGQVTKITVMDQALIDMTVEHYASAARRCVKAGFEMIMIHGAHGNLLTQFISPASNRRTDKYGGSLANRARFIIEILDAVRSVVGSKVAIEYRVSGSELIPNGMNEDDTIEFIKLIQDKIDLVHVSLGGVSDPRALPHFAQPTYFPHEYNVPRAAKLKQALHIPVTCVGSISDLAAAERILAAGQADIVAMGRPHVADPDIVLKSRRGDLDDIRPCIRCQVCGERPSYFYPVRCTVNPVAGRETEYGYLRPAARPKKVVIIGGGPAGMEAAVVASSRGHRVTLFEKNELGGALRYAAAPSFKGDMKRYLDYLIRKTKQSGAEIKLLEANKNNVSDLMPDALIIAIGAEPVVPDIPGIRNGNVVLAGEVDLDLAKTGSRVVVAGAGMTGCETALELALKGKRVTIIDMLPEGEIARDASEAGRLALMDLLQKNNIVIRTETELLEVSDKFAVVMNSRQEREFVPADTVVLALGLRAQTGPADRFRGLAVEEYIVGDCIRPGNLIGAVHDGFNVAAEI